MNPLLSLCVIFHGEEVDPSFPFKRYAQFSDELIVISPGPDDLPPDLQKNLEIPLRSYADGSGLEHLMNLALKKAIGEWILLIHAHEDVTKKDLQRVRDLCKKSKEKAYYLISEKHTENGLSKAFEWIGNIGKYQTPGAKKESFVSSLEIRLFRRESLGKAVFQPDGSFLPLFTGELNNITLLPVSIHNKAVSDALTKEMTREEKILQDYLRFMGEEKEESSKYEGFEFFAPDFIGYALLREKDYPGLVAGLHMGLGSIQILKHMIHALIKKGDYEKAIELSDAVTERLGEHFELWRLKGSAYFYRLELDHAENCYKKALALKAENAEVLFNLAKVYLIKGKHEEARDILIGLREKDLGSHEIDFMIDSMDANECGRATLSLLMVCRDEEDYIGRALTSVQDIVDEMIVIDTGSKDGTKAIAEQFGAKVWDYSWGLHFGNARNEGIQHALGDYILWLDADEFIEDDAKISISILKSLLPQDKRKAILLEVASYREEQNTPNPVPPDRINRRVAIFPRLTGIKFSGRLFESVDASLHKESVEIIAAENVRITHISKNRDVRHQRLNEVLLRCDNESQSSGQLFKGILHWIGCGDIKRAVHWLERAISAAKGDPAHHDTLLSLARLFIQNGFIDEKAPVFKELVSYCESSSEMMSLCAHMLYHEGSYDESARLFEKVLGNGGSHQAYPKDEKSRLSSLVFCAASHLERDHFEKSDEALMEIATSEDLYDARQALHFYSELRKRDVEKGISILDAWIRERNLPITGTINSFTDLIHIVSHMAEIMASYGQKEATTILCRSGHFLAETAIS